MWNKNREVTELTTGNLAAEIKGNLFTPPIESGLLAGTFREQLIEEGSLTVRTLTIDEVKDAERLWMINSVRGWIEIELV